MSFLFRSSELSDYENTTKTLGQKKFSIGFKDTYVVKAQDLLTCNLKPYWAQRQQDQIHINVISNGIKQSNGLYHPFILANIKPRQQFCILDGQHRYEALRRLSDTQLSTIFVQVDVISFEKDDDKWILQQYEFINTTKSFEKEELKEEINVSEIVTDLIKKLKTKRIKDVIISHKQNSKLNITQFKNDLLKRVHRIEDPVAKIVAYNQECCEKHEEMFKHTRIGKIVKQECIDHKFWLGINYPQWLDDLFI
jgi:hypothetical protein